MAAMGDIGYSGPLTLELIFPPLPMLKSFIQCGADCLDYLISLSKKNREMKNRAKCLIFLKIYLNLVLTVKMY